MRCPSCHQSSPAPAPQCPHCRLTLRRLDSKFGALPRHSRFVTDRSASLPLRVIKDLRALLRLYHRKFPQSLFSVVVMRRIDTGSIAEYTFWLANRARFSSVAAVAGENFDVLLALNLHAREAALQVGYGLENYLTERDLKHALAQAAGAFHVDDFGRGIRNCVSFLTDRMREAAKEIEQHENRAPIARAEQT